MRSPSGNTAEKRFQTPRFTVYVEAAGDSPLNGFSCGPRVCIYRRDGFVTLASAYGAPRDSVKRVFREARAMAAASLSRLAASLPT